MMLHAAWWYAAVEKLRNMINAECCRWSIEYWRELYALLKSVNLWMMLQVLYRLLFNMKILPIAMTSSMQTNWLYCLVLVYTCNCSLFFFIICLFSKLCNLTSSRLKKSEIFFLHIWYKFMLLCQILVVYQWVKMVIKRRKMVQTFISLIGHFIGPFSLWLIWNK